MRHVRAFLAVTTLTAAAAATAAAQDPSAPVFDEDTLATFQLSIGAADWSAIVNDPYGQGDLWKSCTMTWQSEAPLGGVAVKAAGKSRYPGYGKPAIRLKFDEFVANRRWRDLDTVKLESMKREWSFQRDRLAYWTWRAMGAPAPRASHARLYVNGVFKGVYMVEEDVKKAFVRHRWSLSTASGNLYEVDLYDLNGTYRGSNFDHYLWRGSTPATYVPSIFKPVTNETGGNYADVVTLLNILNNVAPSDRRAQLLGVVNWDAFLRYLAVVSATSNYDAMTSWGNTPNNHFWYHREDTNRLEVIAWDPDPAFGNAFFVGTPMRADYRINNSIWTNSDWNHMPSTRATSWIQNDAVARGEYLAKIQQVVDGPFATIPARIDFIYNQIKGAVYADPFKPMTNAEFDSFPGILKNWVAARKTSLRSQLPAPTPTVTVSATDASASEPGTNVGTFTLTRSGSTSGTLTVNYTLGGSAGNGTDYNPLGTSVTFAAGASSATVTVAPKDDASVESNETVVLSLAAGTGYALGSPSSATVTIADNDSASLVNNAQYLSNTIPTTMAAGQVATVTVAMKNTGTTTWTGSGTNRYGLGHSAGATPYTWRERRVWLASGETVAPNATKTFSFTITAPSTAGTYAFPQWRMVQDGIGYFGTSSPALTITVTGSASTVTKSFQDGVSPASSYAGTRDAYIAKDNPATNFGTATSVIADGDTNGAGNDARALFRWYVTDIPVGSTVQSARIVLQVSNPSTQTYEFYRVYRYWSETQATWNEAQTGTAWQIAGADGSLDRGQTVRGAVTATAAGTMTVALNSVGVSMVQAWVNEPTSNFGVILLDPANTDGLAFASKESATPGQRPKLEVTYTPPAAAVLDATETAPADSVIDGGENPLTLEDAIGEESFPSAGGGGGGGGGGCGALGLEAAIVLALARLRRRKNRERV